MALFLFFCKSPVLRVGAGVLTGPLSMADQTTWHRPGGPKETRKPQPLPCQGPMARKEGQTPLKFCPPGGTSRQRAPPKTAFWFLCRRGQRNPPPERRNFPAMFFPRMERTKDPRGLAPRSASTPVACPRTPLRGTLPGSRSSNPARVVQLIAFLSAPLPLAEQFADSPASWTRKARLVQAAVGVGSG